MKNYNGVKKLNVNESRERMQKHLNSVKSLMNEAIKNKRVYDIYTKEYRYANNNGVEFANGQVAKSSLIRSQKLIYELHEFIKEEFITYGIDPTLIYPPLKESKPEVKLTGKFKQKDQDISIVPDSIDDSLEKINWGLVRFSGKKSKYGKYKEERILSVNVRSQLSSINKNIDTLFERMLAEPLNLHLQFPKLITGELYMIPVYEYDDSAMLDNKVEFKNTKTDVEKFISFFTALNNYSHDNEEVEPYKYNKAGLVVADFRYDKPKLYETTEQLKKDGIVGKDYEQELNDISPLTLVHDLLTQYHAFYEDEKIEG